jgi:hypothetical protein
LTKGFATKTKSPKALIKDICTTKKLTPQNIGATVVWLQTEWLRDYGNRHPSEPIAKAAFNRGEKKYAEANPKFNMFNKSHTIEEHIFSGFCGSWALMIMRQADGQIDWQVCLWCGDRFAFHPKQVENFALPNLGEQGFKDWKKHVMSEFDSSIKWLMDEAKRLCPGIKAWSAVCCDSSKRLCKQMPGVHVYRGVAFLFT